MDTKQIQYILKVAECQNITRAAEQLFVSQPALSHFISKAEEELGAKIFNRGTTPLTLTQAGERYVKTAKMILSLQESLKQEIENLKDYVNSTEFIEKVARDKLGLVYEDEIIFKAEE